MQFRDRLTGGERSRFRKEVHLLYRPIAPVSLHCRDKSCTITQLSGGENVTEETMGQHREELPEHQIFHLLKEGGQESSGPFSQNEIVELLNSGAVKSSDYVFYPALTDWKRIIDVFDLHQQVNTHGSEGQDPGIVAESFAFMEKRSVENEEIYYIAVQAIQALSLTASVRLRAPQSIVLTNCRFCIIRPKLMGDPEFHEFPLAELERTHVLLEKDDTDGCFRIIPRFGDDAEVYQIPRSQLHRLEEISADLLRDFQSRTAT